MGYEAKLSLKQAPTLALNPALLQALKLLPMARQELVQIIQQELTENPMLEEVPLEEDGDTPTEEEDASSPADAADSATDGTELDDITWVEYVPAEWEWKGVPSEEYEERVAFEHTVRTPTSLQEHLLLQLLTATGDPRHRRVGAFLIGNLDEEGYLRCDMEEAMAATQADRAIVERVLATLQSFDPAGVGARDLRECLRLQIRALGLEGSLLDTIVADYLPQLEARGLAHLADLAKELTKRFNLAPKEVALALRLLRTLDPKPGLRFASEPAETIVPDVWVMKGGQGYQVFLNDEGIPRLCISATYRRLLRDGQAKHYLRDQLRSALSLIHSIEQRRQTLYKVTTSIVKFQREFFEFGLAYLKPLVLKDVAEDIGMHESTVSRVTTNKYMDTERGLFELKYFFHSGLESHGGETLSSLTVKDRIKKLVAAEDPVNPLTDQQLVQRLAAESIKIARRTVTKYRRELKLPPASRRKRSREVSVERDRERVRTRDESLSG
jgi:RNA polymerase sigma-54 factor